LHVSQQLTSRGREKRLALLTLVERFGVLELWNEFRNSD
jgi:hypothetical protein